MGADKTRTVNQVGTTTVSVNVGLAAKHAWSLPHSFVPPKVSQPTDSHHAAGRD